ncbi:uncharacterized protein LOC130589950 [Beta vulgaris subsp. vulgaris]|uniref:uncharacterized protein LOC130589950 n=1 Tax=Beta vulgaris subsp. vulgaris TaxID=3555 RepID=UPI0025485222|nr:uncharacterized protein LOC130589950 [Beta vulgaris subsp. vulgaris]
MERVRRKLNFKGMVAVDCEGEGRGRRGGLALLWHEEWEVKVQHFSLHHIDALIASAIMPEWRFTGIYGWPEEVNKVKTGELMVNLHDGTGVPWLCGGDLNLMMWSNEKQGGSEFRYEDAAILRNAMDVCQLDDMHYVGHPFTWTNNQGGEKNLQERLDRCCANQEWKDIFGGSFVTHLEKRRSDHLPILMTLRTSLTTPRDRKKTRIFRFEEMWTKDGACDDIIKAAWCKGADAKENLVRTATKLREWSKGKFGHFAKEMRGYQDQMRSLMEGPQTPEAIAQMRMIDARMDEMESREEVYWRQRSRQDWLKYGDRNTKFFHAKAKQRQTRNSITKITDAGGIEYEEETEIAEVLTQHFETLFSANDCVEMDPVLEIIKEKVPTGLQEMLKAEYTREEVQEALSQMHPTKAPGPDGMCALFYQKFWDIVGLDVTEKVLDILNHGGDVRPLNHTHIVLIPKKKVCESPVDFRPISLCNVLYKLVSKVLANRLKRVLPVVIHESQSGFVPGRLITDNILVAYECFHFLRKKKKGKTGYMGLKLDMSKAYDRVEWDFLEQMMLKLGFPVNFVHLIISCVKTSSFSLLVNGQPARRFTPSRGLRQGDPLSPFLFIICAEGLSSLLRDAEAKREIHGLKIGKRVNSISHLFFADDSLLFTRANEEEVEKILDILGTYEAASGQKLNMEKSQVSFSRNIEQEKQDTLQMKLTFKAVEEHEKYLGLPTYIGSSKKRVFQCIQERVLKKLKGWKESFLSQAGREVLIKAVAQAIPTYAMQCFNIPVSILNEIEKLCRSFFWGQKKEEKKMAWVAWEKMYGSKNEGGLGMRNLVVFNKAMLAKQAWRVLKYPESLMAKVLKNKYFPNTTLMKVKVSPMASFTWKSILSARDLLDKGIRKVVGNGLHIDIWDDPWVPTLPRYRVIPQERRDNRPQMVNEFIGERGWQKGELERWLSKWEVDEIMRIPLPIRHCEDKWCWSHTKNGEFSVRSAYYVELAQRKTNKATASTDVTKQVWKKLWSALVPNKVRHFGWKALHNGLPMRDNLSRRGCVVDNICPMCGSDVETPFHALVLCPSAQVVWKISPLRLVFKEGMGTSIMEWVACLILKYTDEAWWALFWSLLWGIWLARNSWVFENRKLDAMTVVERAQCRVGEFQEAQDNDKVASLVCRGGENRWKAPSDGWFKVNSDAAVFEDGTIGCGGIMRDWLGEVMAATVWLGNGGMAVDEAEAVALRHAVEIAIEAGLRDLVVESDNLKLINHLKKGMKENTSFGNIVADILNLVCVCRRLIFNHVGRNGNRAAHKLAHLSREYSEMRVWIEEVPPGVLGDVMFDLSNLNV